MSLVKKPLTPVHQTLSLSHSLSRSISRSDSLSLARSISLDRSLVKETSNKQCTRTHGVAQWPKLAAITKPEQHVVLLERSFAFTPIACIPRRTLTTTQFATRSDGSSTRRQLLSWGLSSFSFLSMPSHAFDSKISNKYDDRPKRRGPQVTCRGLYCCLMLSCFPHTCCSLSTNCSQKTWESQSERT
jgi:hypothetical protein